jgi:hypothetical protein
MNNYTNLLQIVDELEANGKTITYTKLPTQKPRKALLTANRIKGSSTRVRTNGGSHSINTSGNNSALTDLY